MIIIMLNGVWSAPNSSLSKHLGRERVLLLCCQDLCILHVLYSDSSNMRKLTSKTGNNIMTIKMEGDGKPFYVGTFARLLYLVYIATTWQVMLDMQLFASQTDEGGANSVKEEVVTGREVLDDCCPHLSGSLGTGPG